jgi:4-hydroxybenzoate polyprenyltransferase
MLLKTENKLYHFARALRPRQWIKNLAVFVPLVFSGELYNEDFLYKAFLAFCYFCATASSLYLINDVADLESDQKHPIKKNRPLASGRISPNFAFIAAIVILFIAIPTSFIYVGKYFGLLLTLYLIIQVLYTFYLKNIIIIDALTITIGFVLRVYAGALAIPISVSSWLILAVIGLSLLLAFGKRRAERTLLYAKNISNEETRKILKHYPDTLLDSMISMSASFAIITYSLFAFQSSPTGIKELSLLVPSTLASAKWLMLTIPIVIYAVARYLYVIYEKKEGESPDRVIISDNPLLASAVIWGLFVAVLMNGYEFR